MLLGYAITIAVVLSFILMMLSIFLYRKELYKLLKKHTNKKAIIFLIVILIFFTIISLLFIPAVEQLYFDENIYQGIALNIVHSGNSLWCQYGTGYLTNCYSNQLYHDPVGFELFLGIIFLIFGSGPSISYAFQFFIGVLSVIGVFLLASVLTENKYLGAISAFIFSTIPELLIWTRTQAAPDLPFMMLTIYSFFFFVVFTKNENKRSLLLFLSSFSLVLYTRIEAFILFPVFLILYFIFGEYKPIELIKKRISSIKNLQYNFYALIILLLFIFLILPEFFYVNTESLSPQYGQASNQSILSVSNFLQNINYNSGFFLGTTTNYPTISSINLLVLSILGIFTILLLKKIKNKFGILLAMLLPIFIYFLFYTFFYAGSVDYGVDVRFMLELMPFLAILSGIGILGLFNTVSFILSKLKLKAAKKLAVLFIPIFVIVGVILPFYFIFPYISLPISQMPQEYFNTQATTFIYNNYQKVPTSCLVFSFTPDIWYTLNRSSAQISYMSEGNLTTKMNTFKNYSCFVFDYGYWCTTPEYHNSSCGTQLYSYNLSVLATQRNSEGSNFTLYKINNFT